MWFRVTPLIVALVTLVHTGDFTENTKCGMAYVSVGATFFGKLPPVILIHGLSYTKETWDGICEKIPLSTGRRAIAYDARNHGKSFWNDTFTVPVLVDDLKCFMDAMNIERAALVGHSVGGLIAMQFALKYPSKVERMFVEDIGPNISSDVLAIDEKELNLLVDSEKAAPKNASQAMAKRAIDNYIRQVAPGTDPQGVFQQKTPVIYRDGAWHWQLNVKALAKALEVEQLNATLGKYQGHYNGECLFIYSIDSPLKVGEQKPSIKVLYPKTKFVAVPGVEHFIHTTHREEFCIVLMKFLNCLPVGTD